MERSTERADVVVVLAKEPRPGRVKTRLQSAFTPEQAADLAGCALRDTLRAVRASAAPRRAIVWEGDAGGFDSSSDWGVEVVPQRCGSLNDRLTGAFADLGDPPGRRILLIGMDTPQVTAALLDSDWDGCDALLGLSEDGGFWAIGLRTPDVASRFAGIEMSTNRTGAAQLARLVSLGHTVKLLPPLRDVDEPGDADQVGRAHPWLEFSRRHAELVRGDGPEDPDHLFDRLYAGTAVRADDVNAELNRVGGEGVLTLDQVRWATRADAVDKLVVSRCRAPVLDVGCGPGRMVQALNEAGVAALGVDMSSEAVRATRARGALAVRARLADRLPAEGRWGTVLLMDGNIGIGGDVDAVLRRCRELLTAGGRIVAEVDGSPTRSDTRRVRLTEPATGRSADLDWARMGTEPFRALASRHDLLVTEEWAAGGRVFLALQVAP